MRMSYEAHVSSNDRRGIYLPILATILHRSCEHPDDFAYKYTWKKNYYTIIPILSTLKKKKKKLNTMT